MAPRDNLERRAELGDPQARMELYRREARRGSRTHMEILAFASQLFEADPKAGDVQTFEEADARYQRARKAGWAFLADTLGRATSLDKLYDVASKFDITIQVNSRLVIQETLVRAISRTIAFILISLLRFYIAFASVLI